jgi:PTH1 family peptidyl-tRNA hydrolase
LFFFRPKRKHVDVVIVGLGNPGPRYARSRHNLGFAVVDKLAREWTDEKSWHAASNYLWLDGKLGAGSYLLLKPTTFMNLSGNVLRKAGRKFDFTQESLIVVHDDLDVNYGKVKFKLGGSPAGHKGVASIATHLGTQDFYHLKIGIGQEGTKSGMNYVLEQLNEDEWAEFGPSVELACRGLDIFLRQGPDEAIRYVNTHGKKLAEGGTGESVDNGG